MSNLQKQNHGEGSRSHESKKKNKSEEGAESAGKRNTPPTNPDPYESLSDLDMSGLIIPGNIEQIAREVGSNLKHFWNGVPDPTRQRERDLSSIYRDPKSSMN
nr:hypothetical protein Iba_chr14bCG4490 [Ipomoea batatas]